MPTGKIARWKDDEGYGFITPDAGGEDVFFHISAASRFQDRPQTGDRVSYRIERANDGRLRASNVRQRSQGQWAWPIWAALAGVLAALLIIALLPPVWGLYAALCLVMSAVTWIAYARDKRAAITGNNPAHRTPERTLHTLELMGGWSGALLAQHLYRHKVRDMRYQVIYWLIVAGHVALLAALAVLA